MAEKKVKTVTETTHIVDASGESVAECITYLQEQDEKGNVLLDASWQTNGALENKSSYTYNEANQRISQDIFLDDENISEHWSYEYDENGQLIRRTVEYADGSHSYYTKTTAEDGATVWEITDEDQEFEGKEIRVFKDEKLLLRSIDIDDENSETLRKEFVYDEKDNLIEQHIYEYEALSSKELMQYDDQGNLKRSVSLSPGGNKISDMEYTYNAENKVMHYDVNKEVRTQFTYDEQGREIEIKRTNLQSELNMGLTQMKYNEAGDLVERLVYQMGTQYQVEPGVMGRSSSVHQKVVLSYEYW